MPTKRSSVTLGDIGPLIQSWVRHLQAAGLSRATLQNYERAARQLHLYLADKRMPTDVASHP